MDYRECITSVERVRTTTTMAKQFLFLPKYYYLPSKCMKV